MKSIQLIVTLNFDNEITDDNEIQEVVENTFSAITDRVQNGFISPVENDNVSLDNIVVLETLKGIQRNYNV